MNYAENLARLDGKHTDIKTTAEGKSFLRGRYFYHLRRLGGDTK